MSKNCKFSRYQPPMIKIYEDLLQKKWIEVYDQSEKNYNVNKEIKTSMLRSDLCDYSDRL